jgi:hypothetical protein
MKAFLKGVETWKKETIEKRVNLLQFRCHTYVSFSCYTNWTAFVSFRRLHKGCTKYVREHENDEFVLPNAKALPFD